MERAALEAAITNSRGVLPAGDELAHLLAKIDGLEQTGRHASLLDQLAKANDKANFLAALLEVTFASQFESQGLQLAREIKQTPEMPGSVDFRRSFAGGHLDMEVRLVQQDQKTTDQIREQLDQGPFFAVAMDAGAQMKAICRAQNIILSKIQDPDDGTPAKFAAPQAGVTNIVVVDTHDLFLGGIDVDDCRLVAYGDPAVQREYRLGLFGLFQQLHGADGAELQQHYERFTHARATVHGLMFLFRTPGSGIFNYGLLQFMCWNSELIDVDRSAIAMAEIHRAIPFNGV